MRDGTLDELDRHILYALQQDARHTSSGDIAEERGISASTVRKRIQQLEEEGIISGYHVEIIIASIGLSNGIIDEGLFSILVFLAIFTTALVPVTVKWGVDWLDQAGELVYTQDPAEPTAD